MSSKYKLLHASREDSFSLLLPQVSAQSLRARASPALILSLFNTLHADFGALLAGLVHDTKSALSGGDGGASEGGGG
eukprot:4199662-Pleurochrysis_carterae.AAC.1